MQTPLRFAPAFVFALLAACSGSGAIAPLEDASTDSTVADSTGDVAMETSLETATETAAETTTETAAETTTDTSSDAPVGDSGGGACGTDGACGTGLKCCGTACVNQANDPLNCGGCRIRCTGTTSMCAGGKCSAPTCSPACTDGQSCCDVNSGGPTGGPKCYDGPTCPVGCPACA